jgi:hypothetical protein
MMGFFKKIKYKEDKKLFSFKGNSCGDLKESS